MGFFGSLFGDKIQNENKSKPFSRCTSAEERMNWFARTRPWHKVSPKVLEALAAKLEAQPVMFELFVLTSMKQGLVPQYEQMNAENAVGEVACAMVGGILTRIGGPLAQQVVATTEYPLYGPRLAPGW